MVLVGLGVDDASERAPLEDGAREATFKAWDAKGTAYKAFVDGLKGGRDEAFEGRARQRRYSASSA